MRPHIVPIKLGRLPIVSLSIGERNRRLHKVLRWARKKSNQELSDYIARFPKAAGKLAANLLRDDHGVPQTNNLKLDVAAHVLKRRHQGRETYSPGGEDSV
jgi:hypothetical protein